MTTLTHDTSAAHAAEGVAPKAGLSLSHRISAAYHGIIETRTRRAQTQVNGYLSSLNDETLIDLGLDPAAVRHGDPLKRFYL
jgi:phospholipase/lecithinase/hemolysin